MAEQIELNIANIVASGMLGIGEIDTSAVGESLNLDNVSVYPGRVYMSQNNGPTVMIYRKGTYAIAGAKSHESLIEAVDWMTTELRKISVPVESPVDSLEVKYIVYTADLERALDLEMLLIELGLENTEYEPEQFPGLLYRDSEYDCTILLFGSGKIVITGARDQEVARECLNRIATAID